MAKINDNYLKLKAGYLFPEIGRRVREFAAANPSAKVIRLGIGDVTRPLAPTVIKAFHQAVDDLATTSNFAGYGLGWNLNDYRGEKIVSHTGGLFGMVSRVTMIPSKKLGVIVLTNQEAGAAFNAITYTVLDHYLNAPPADWVAAQKQALDARKADAAKKVAGEAAKRNAQSKPSLPLASYAGRYRDAWYGDIIVEESAGALRMRFTHSPSLNGTMEHFQYDTFIARWGDRTMNADAYVTFTLSSEGTIEQVKMKAVSPLTDFSFDFHHLDLKPVARDAPPYD